VHNGAIFLSSDQCNKYNYSLVVHGTYWTVNPLATISVTFTGISLNKNLCTHVINSVYAHVGGLNDKRKVQYSHTNQ